MSDNFNHKLAIQINDYDSYQVEPSKLDDLYIEVSHVPIIRIYGSISLSNQVFNVLLHVHNYFPYVYLDCVGELSLDQVHDYLETTLSNSFLKKDDEEDDFPSHGLRKYIAKVAKCKGLPIYGFRVGEKLLYKVSLLSPKYKTRIMKLIHNGDIRFNGEMVDIYEGHIPFLLQFLIDFNLYGCGWLYCSLESLYFRSPILEPFSMNSYLPEQIDKLIIDLEKLIQPENVLSYKRIGKSLLEIDVSTKTILNRKSIQLRHLHNGFSELDDFSKLAPNHEESHTYLSSLRFIHADLKFQAETRDSSFNLHDAPTIYKHSTFDHKQAVHYLGTYAGNTNWSNQQELDDLLKYVIKLNKPLAVKDLEEYYRKNYKVPAKEVLTCFELVDHEMELRHGTLFYGVDLINWKGDLGNLFGSELIVPEEIVSDSIVSESIANVHSGGGTSARTSEGYETVEAVNAADVLLNTSLGAPMGATLVKSSLGPALLTSSPRPTTHAVKFPTILTELILNMSFNSDFSVLQNEQANNSEDSADHSMEEAPSPRGIPHTSDISEEDEEDEGKYSSQPSDDPVNSELEDSQINITQPGELDENLFLQLTQNPRRQIPSSKPNVQITSSLDDLHGYYHNSSLRQASNVDLQIPSSLEESVINVALQKHAYEVIVPDTFQPENVTRYFDLHGILKINYQDPYYDKASDLPLKPLVVSNRKITIPVLDEKLIPSLPISSKIAASILDNKTSAQGTIGLFSDWEYLVQPPLKRCILDWLEQEILRTKKRANFKSQIEPGVTQKKYKLSYNSVKVTRKPESFNNLTNLLLEVHSITSDNFSPDPTMNPVSLIFYNFDDSNGMFDGVPTSAILTTRGTVLPNLEKYLSHDDLITIFDSELEMIEHLIEVVDKFDPDILSGYEVNASSWGYIIERFRIVHDINLCAEFSRGRFKSNGKVGDRWGYTHTSNIKINGRHIINVWRTLRSAMSLTSYSLESVSYQLLHQTLPRYLNLQLSTWCESGSFLHQLLVLQYYTRRIELTIKIMDVQEVITRNVEQSRLVGIDFNSNFYRGSQYKVESILCRLTKQENIVLNSPSKQQVHEMRPLECIPLIMEPTSNFYKSPLVVLDFQSLYPSVISAYNYCYSTLIGKLHNFKPKKNAVGYLKNVGLPPGLLNLLNENDCITTSPNGFMFVKSKVRKSSLAKMLEEMLDTRIVVKTGMKLFKDDPELNKLYNARQLALKLIANVTYGYSSATFSGRMPNSDVADSIVATGRELLMQSIDIIESGNYGAKVVYGDTDSLFVYFPGKSKNEAFKLGRQIAEKVTNHFPDPVTLKFEKVYHPCVLLAKKRYVGYSYEHEGQKDPKFDAKGIETVRRDGVPAQLKMVERSLRLLFESKNLSTVKRYAMEQFHKISINKISVYDFCFAKEVRYGTYRNVTYLPPGAIVAEKKALKDPRMEPQYKERVPYVVIRDVTKHRLKDRCISPDDYLESYTGTSPLSLDYEYYINKVLIPPLQRIFGLIGVDVKGWYKEMPRFIQNESLRSNTIFDVSSVITTKECINYGATVKNPNHSCVHCQLDELQLMVNLTMQKKQQQLKLAYIGATCNSCVAVNFSMTGNGLRNSALCECKNIDCPTFYDRFKVVNECKEFEVTGGKVLEQLVW